LATFVPHPRHCFPKDIDYAKFGTYDYWEFPIHCGPYILESVKFPDYCVLVRNENWYGPKPGIKTIHGLSFDTGGVDAAAAALIAGELDLVHSNDYNDINFAKNIVAKNPDYGYNAFAAPYFRFFATNITGSADGKWNTFMANANFRKAINLAIDKQAIASYFPGQAVPLATLVNPGDSYYNKSVPAFKRDVEKAKALLKASGYNGAPLRVAYYYSDQTTADLIDLVCQNLSEIGIPAESQLFTQNLANAIYESKNWDILYAGANQMSGIENYNIIVSGAIYDKYLGNVKERDELFTKYMTEVRRTSDSKRLRELGNILQTNGLEYGAPIPVIAMDKIMVYNKAKWAFDPVWLKSSDLAIYRTCDLRLEKWSLLKP
jgi:ABC-type transport system substrate-binding protein